MSNSKINFSIIIPHYNTPKLLCRCLDSIPRRNDIQIIVVDDNSSPDIVDFKNFPGLHDTFVEVYLTKEGKGAGYARNIGLQHAKGKWLLFADADDFFLENAFILCDNYISSEYDIIYFGIDSVDSETGERVDRYKIYNKYVEGCDNYTQRTINLLRFRHDVPWGKMISHELVKRNNIVFGETKYCNDTLFSTKTAICADKIYAEKKPFYCVTACRNSLITHKNISAEFIRYEVILQKNRLLRENGYNRYQLPITYYMRIFYKDSFLNFLKFLRLGFKYKVNFFIGTFDALKRRI